MTTLKCIAIDDEPLALRLIETFAGQTPFIDLSGSFSSAFEAMQLIKEQSVDLLFLDIDMPKFSGMELAKWMQQQPHPLPKIIFTTAYHHFAIEGYKVNALDYLLKPFGYEEFLRAATKALQLAEQPNFTSSRLQQDDSIFIKVEHHWERIHLGDILFIESLRDYVRIQLQGQSKSVLSLTSLKILEERLPLALFMRIHRSFIVSLQKINVINKQSIVIGNKEIPVGEQYREAFKAVTNKWLRQ